MYILLTILIITVLFFIFKYNGIIGLKNKVKQAYADIDVQIKNRFDLVGNLVNTVKGYANHEKETLIKLTDARTNFSNSNTVSEKMEADNQMSKALKSLFAVSENYPDLKANENFLELQTELSDLENKIAATRRFLNSTVQEYNTAIQVFPSNIIAGMFNFKEEKSFKLENEEEKKVPIVDF